MVELSFRVFPNLKDYRVQAATHPADGAMLIREVRTLVGVIGMIENLLYFLEANSRFGFRRRLLLFRSSKWNRTRYNCYTIAAGGIEPGFEEESGEEKIPTHAAHEWGTRLRKAHRQFWFMAVAGMAFIRCSSLAASSLRPKLRRALA